MITKGPSTVWSCRALETYLFDVLEELGSHGFSAKRVDPPLIHVELQFPEAISRERIVAACALVDEDTRLLVETLMPCPMEDNPMMLDQ